MKNYKKPIILLIFIFFVLSSMVLADSYTLIDTNEYLLRNIYEIYNDGKNPIINISIKILLGADTNSPYQKRLSFQLDPRPSSIETDDWGNTYARIDIMSLQPGEKMDILVEKNIQNSGISYDKNIYSLDSDNRNFLKSPSNYKYILPSLKIESNDLRIINKANEIAKTGTIIEKARKIYDFVNLHIDYDKNSSYANKGALSGLVNARGVCDEYAYLFTALCRSIGIPSRVVSGYWKTGELPKEKWIDLSQDGHSWSEFYIDTLGWVPVEPTFNYVYNGKRMPNKDYFANIKGDSRHFINSYSDDGSKKDIDVQYSFYESEGTSVKLKLKDQRIMLLKESSKPIKESQLKDIDNNWAKVYIEKLYNEGVIFAKTDGLYKPASKITRAEFAAFIISAMGLQELEGDLEYKDLDFNHQFAGEIKAATRIGIIQGYNGYYYPDQSIKREDMALIIKRALDFLKIENDARSMIDYKDKNSISRYAIDGVKSMNKLGIMEGKPGNIFAPKDYVTRAEAAKIIFVFKDYFAN